MARPGKHPWLWLVAVLSLALAAMAAVSREELELAPAIQTAPVEDPLQSTPRATADKPTALEIPDLKLALLQRPHADTGIKDAFAAKSWYVAPPPPPPVKVQPPPPPKPMAPKVPFTYMGKFQEEAGKAVIYLVKGEHVYAVSEGDVIDNTYQIGAADAQQLQLTYLPLNIKQSIRTGAS